jgi:glycine oxidase
LMHWSCDTLAMASVIPHNSPDMILIGAGVMGMMSALELADSGMTVRLYDRGRAGREASWAGGGIISPLYPWRYQPHITALASWSQANYPGLIKQLSESTGVDPECLPRGMLVTAMQERSQALAWGSGINPQVMEITATDARALEPHVELTETPLWMPEIASVRNPRLGQALRLACLRHARIELVEQCPIDVQGSADAPVVLAQGEPVVSGQVGLTGGAWSATLCQALGIQCPVKPMKGQMLLFASCHLVSRVVLADGRYAIPRGDGRLVFGSTLEDVGFDALPDAAGLATLYQSALKMIPALESVPLEAQWAGLRPGSPEGTPWIGAFSDRLWINAGHYRNGVVLAPASARLFADLVCGRHPVIDPTPFQPREM